MQLAYEASNYNAEYSMTVEAMEIATVHRACLMRHRLCTLSGFTSFERWLKPCSLENFTVIK